MRCCNKCRAHGFVVMVYCYVSNRWFKPNHGIYVVCSVLRQDTLIHLLVHPVTVGTSSHWGINLIGVPSTGVPSVESQSYPLGKSEGKEPYQVLCARRLRERFNLCLVFQRVQNVITHC